MFNILLIEDDLEFAELIVSFLAKKSIKTEVFDDPFKALVVNLKKYDLVLLDIGLPGIDGLEICKEFRYKSKIPIIISSARGSVSDKVLGLQIGADDYLPKPYNPNELHARILSLLRRVKDMEVGDMTKEDFEIDTKSRDVLFKEEPLDLTEAEYQVCKELIKSKGNVVSKEQLLYNSSAITSNDGKSLEVIISKIRKKIEKYSKEKYIIALRGRGYRLAQ